MRGFSESKDNRQRVQLQNRYRDAYRLKQYNLTPRQYRQMLKDQNYGCAICHIRAGSRKLAVDHDHETGQVRGLLCSKCNTSLGMVGDNPRILAAMIVYLEDHGRVYSEFED